MSVLIFELATGLGQHGVSMTRLHGGQMTVVFAALLGGCMMQSALASAPVQATAPPGAAFNPDDLQITQSRSASSERSAPLSLRLTLIAPPSVAPPSTTPQPAANAVPPLQLRRIEYGAAPVPPPAPASQRVGGYLPRYTPQQAAPVPMTPSQLPLPSSDLHSVPPPMLATQPLLINAAPTIYDGAPPAPNANVLLPEATGGYLIGAGDTVQIDVLSRPELSAKGNVAADGRVTVALVGAVHIGGLTPGQAADRIAGAYRQGQFLVAPQVTVTIVDYQSQQITVLGEVRNPGRFPLRSRLSLLDGLALAGGVNEQGASLAYLLRPSNGVINRFVIDLEMLIQEGGGQRTFPLLPGDTLLVPKTEVFYIYGEVRNPNAYRLKPGITVIQALSLAGGLTDKGSDRRIDIRRKAADGRLQTLTASLNETLLVDDVLYVRERLF